MSEIPMNTPSDQTSTPQAPPPEATQPPEGAAAPQAPEDPSIIGEVTPEEHATLMAIRGEQQQLLMKLGEYSFLTSRINGRLAELDATIQHHINAISQRLGVEDGQQWVALNDRRVKLVDKPPPGQNQGGGGAVPPGQ